MKHYRVDLGNSNYVGPSFSCVEEAAMWAQDRGYITFNEDEERYESSIEIVEFQD